MSNQTAQWTPPYTALALTEIPPADDGGLQWRPIRHELGITAHGVNAYTGHEVGDQVLDDHDEANTGHEELYVVLTGRATFTLGESETVDAPAGTLVFVREPGMRRVAHAAQADTTILCTGGIPGTFAPSAWETRQLQGR
jgi:mannose-6-phosphate isomerase-like protein (cupin superfamily)